MTSPINVTIKQDSTTLTTNPETPPTNPDNNPQDNETKTTSGVTGQGPVVDNTKQNADKKPAKLAKPVETTTKNTQNKYISQYIANPNADMSIEFKKLLKNNGVVFRNTGGNWNNR